MNSFPFGLRLWLVSAALFTATVVSAQDPTTPVGIAPVEDPNDMIEFSLRDETLAQVLYLLEQLTGRSVIRPQALPSPTFTFNSLQPLTRQEAILAIESLLSINGIGVAPLGDKFIKVVPISTIRTEAPELVVRSLIGDPPSGKVVSKLFRLTYLDSATFQAQIQPFLSPGFGTIIPFQNSNAVIVTDTISNLQRLEYVVSEVDKPSRLNIETKFYVLQYAKASEVGTQIRTLIETARSGFGGGAPTTPNRAQSTQAQVQPEVGPPAAGGEGGSSIPIQVILGGNTSINFDDRTNQLIVITDPANLPFFDNIIEKLDIPADPPTRIEVVPLQHADATEVGSLLSQFVTGRTRQDGQDVVTTNRNTRASPLRNTFGDAPDRVGALATQNNPTRQAVQQAVESTLENRESQFSDFMTIVADERSNALIVSGTNGDLDLIGEIIKKIDIVLAQVRIEVVIAQVQLSDTVQRGIDSFNLQYNTQLGRITKFATEIGSVSVAGSLIGESSDYLVDAIFDAAKTNNSIQLLSAPTIVTTHNKEATIIVAESRPIITSSQTSLTVGDSTRSTFQFQDIGITLKVKPLIGPNDVIQMEIDQTVDDVVDFVEIDGNQQPVIGRRQATSFVSVSSDEMIVLGGLRQQRTKRNKSRMFILGEIPVLGSLFTSYDDEDVDQELVVFIRPLVIRNTAEAFVNATERLDEMKNPERVRVFMENQPEPPAGAENPSDADAPKSTSHFHKR